MTEKDKYQLLLDELIGPLKGFVNTLTKKNELLSNKVKSILENKDSDEKYPTVKAVYDFIRESINSISFDGFETTDNKVKKLDETSTDGQYPTAKGVYDLVKSEKESGIKDKVFERIATYTVTPDSDGSLPTKITINKDNDGNPFELTDVYCDVLIGLTDGLTGRFYVSVGNPSERNMISVMGNATLNINNTQLRKWCFRVDNYGDGRGGLTSAPSVSLMHTADFPSANVSTMYGQPIPVWRTIDIREVQFVGQAGNTQTFMEGTTITLWGVRKQ